MRNRERLVRVVICLVFVASFGVMVNGGLHFAEVLKAGTIEAVIGSGQSADLNLDGAVDLRDYALFQNQFGGPIPAWLQELIDGFEAGGVMYSPLAVWQYRYNGELVYYVPPRCCDVMAVLYDVYGVRICHPTGGITGEGDGLCPDFFDERTDEILIWEDPRG